MRNSVRLKIISTAVLLLCIAISLTAASVAWLASMITVDTAEDITASSIASYFASGDGKTAETAYVIKTPTHLYNLAWLQNSGVFTEKKYFKLDGAIDMKGAIHGDGMTGGAIPPIGTKDAPFIGEFEGGGAVISNLWISTVMDDWKEHPEGCEEYSSTHVGLFGAIGAGAVVNDFILDKVEIKSHINNAKVGIISGYVDGKLSNVGVYNGIVTLTAGTACSSEYTLLGEISENMSWTDKPSEEGSGGDLVIDPNDYENNGASEFNDVAAGTAVQVPYSIAGTAYYGGELEVLGANISSKAIWDMRNYNNGSGNVTFVSDGSREPEQIANAYEQYGQGATIIHAPNAPFNTSGNPTGTVSATDENGNPISIPQSGIWFKPQGAGRVAMAFAATNQSTNRYMMLYICERDSSGNLKAVDTVEYILPLKECKSFKNGHIAYYEYNISESDAGKYEYVIGATNISGHSTDQVGFFILMLAGTDITGGDGGASDDGKVIDNIDYVTSTTVDISAADYEVHNTILKIDAGTVTSAGSIYYLARESGGASKVYYSNPANLGITITDISEGKESQMTDEDVFADRLQS